MNQFIRDVEIRWSDLDPNFHLRHSVYYDFGAFVRIAFFTSNGITPQVMTQHNIGPILFREECIFKKEIRLGDEVTIDVSLIKSRKDFSRLTFRHQVMKNKDLLSAILTLDVAWMNTTERKLAIPPQEVCSVMDAIPKDASFQWLEK